MAIVLVAHLPEFERGIAVPFLIMALAFAAAAGALLGGPVAVLRDWR